MSAASYALLLVYYSIPSTLSGFMFVLFLLTILPEALESLSRTEQDATLACALAGSIVFYKACETSFICLSM